MTLPHFYRIFYRLTILRYRMQVSGLDEIKADKTYFMLPAHTAYVEPFITFGNCWKTPFRPMAAEYLFHIPLGGWLLNRIDAVSVPELTGEKNDPRAMVEYAHKLTEIGIKTLKEGRNLCIYPAGHVRKKWEDKEVIGNRRMAYEICKDLPEGVEIVLSRNKGLEGSLTARTKWKPTLFRRKVTLEYKVMTEEVREWAKTLSRKEFNQKLEEWYNR